MFYILDSAFQLLSAIDFFKKKSIQVKFIIIYCKEPRFQIVVTESITGQQKQMMWNHISLKDILQQFELN